MELLIGWLAWGLVGSLAAIFMFRPDGTTNKKGELYMIVVAPLFGPIVMIMIFVDLIRRP